MAEEDTLASDNEYSRLLAVLGREGLERLQANRCLVSGMKGLGMEIAKSLVLMGVKNMTIADTEKVEIRDLSSNFFLRADDVGKNRAEAVRDRLFELNDRCNLQVLTEPLTESVLATFQQVVLTNNHSHEELVRFGDACHAAGVSFIASDLWGVFGYIFVDLGDNHTIKDRTGERPKEGFISSVTVTDGEVFVLSAERHDLEDGNHVRLSEITGFEGDPLDEKEFTVKVLDPFNFSIGSPEGGVQGSYLKGGQFVEVRQPIAMSFDGLSASLGKDLDIMEGVVHTDWEKMFTAPSYRVAAQAVLQYRQKHDGALPAAHDDAAADEVVALAKAINEAGPTTELDEDLVAKVARQARGDLSPTAAVFGGIIAQEVIKASSGKYTPIHQWLFYEATEALPEVTDPANFAETGTRYDGQVVLFGQDFQRKLGDLTYFLVGAGAIGCEIIKNWAMMGIGAGPKGLIHVTDMDIIEISNLNRQFLYRSGDVSKPKSETAAKAAAVMNPDMHLRAYTTKVAPETEDQYNHDFWESLDGVCNALDNIKARLYVDSRCVFFGKSLLESGTLGTKGNTQVVIPHVTESYGESKDPEPKETAKCLLHSFPSNIEHCLQWSRELLFEGEFVLNPEEVNDYVTKENFLDSVPSREVPKKVRILHATLSDRPSSLDDCIMWARRLFEEWYNHKPIQLMHTYPADAKDSRGNPFWTGSRRPPTPQTFDVENEMHLGFVVASTFLRAYTCGLLDSEFKGSDYVEKVAHIKEVAATITFPAFVPKEGVKIQTEEDGEDGEEDDEGDADDAAVAALRAALPTPESLGEFRMRPLDFEKDDDSNFHIDFVHTAANIRAVAYGIKTVDRLKSKLIAGRIIPAIVTTTAVVAGLVCLEFLKIHQGDKPLSAYRNCFLNLGIPVFQLTEPAPPVTFEFKGTKHTSWSAVHIKEGDITLQQLLDVLKEKHDCDVYAISYGAKQKLLYRSVGGDYTTNLATKVSDLVRDAQGHDFADKQICFKLNVVADTDDDDDDFGDWGEGGDAEPVDEFPPVWFFFQ